MAKKTAPIITHTEMICYTIRYIEAQIEEWKTRCAQLKGVEVDEIAAEQVAYLNPKLDALKEMYRFETGQEYC